MDGPLAQNFFLIDLKYIMSNHKEWYGISDFRKTDDASKNYLLKTQIRLRIWAQEIFVVFVKNSKELLLKNWILHRILNTEHY